MTMEGFVGSYVYIKMKLKVAETTASLQDLFVWMDHGWCCLDIYKLSLWLVDRCSFVLLSVAFPLFQHHRKWFHNVVDSLFKDVYLFSHCVWNNDFLVNTVCKSFY